MPAELVVLYIIPAIVALIGCALSIWGADQVTIGDVCIIVIMVAAPGLNLICAAMFINMGVTDMLIPSLSFIWDRPLWRKKDK